MKMNAFEAFNANALKYENKFMHLDIYNAAYDAFLAHLKSNATVLEAGCGPGNISRYLLDKRQDLNILATDFSPNMIELATKNLPEGEARVLDAKEISSLEKKFDGVVCGFIAPYFDQAELQKLLSDCAEIMNSEGALYISCINGEHAQSGWMSSSDGKTSAFVYYYNRADLTEMLARAGFSVSETFEIAYDDDVHMILIADKKRAVN